MRIQRIRTLEQIITLLSVAAIFIMGLLAAIVAIGVLSSRQESLSKLPLRLEVSRCNANEEDNFKVKSGYSFDISSFRNFHHFSKKGRVL